MELTTEEKLHYSRHLLMPELGEEGQLKLKQAKVLIIGAGGLGCPVLQYLAAAGIGKIGIVDGDVVEESNLHRQILFSVNDLKQPKAEIAAKKLRLLNPHIDITVYNEFLDSDNALEIISEYDIVADGTDNFATRYLVNDACVITGKINVFASILKFQGQVTVFNYSENKKRGINYRDLFPTPPKAGSIPSCAEAGVLGVLPGLVGSIQANEVIKLITGIGSTLSGELLTIDALTMNTTKLNLAVDPKQKPITKLIDYDIFCGTKKDDKIEITVSEFNALKQSGEPFYLLDVREQSEYELANLGGKLIPLSQLEARSNEIPKDKKIVVHCKMGGRSAQAIEILKEKGIEHIYNLKGGIDEYLRYEHNRR